MQTKLTPDQWRLEPAVVTDVSFIIDSWCSDEALKSGRSSGVDPDVFKVGHRARILRLLSSCRAAVIRPTSAYFSAHGQHPDPRKLFGWCLYSLDRATLRPIVHFAYVKADYRRQGLADALLKVAGVRPEQGAWCTHFRLHLRDAAQARGIEYNYFLLDYDPAATPALQDPYR